MVKRMVKKELGLVNCGFSHDPVDAVVRSQWQAQSRSLIYLTYRWLVAVFVVGVVAIALHAHLQKYTIGTFFIYFTRWGITLNMIVGVYGAILVTIWHFHTDYQETVMKNEKMPISFKIYWALHNIALVTAFIISIVYWSVLHVEHKRIDLANILSHAMNSVIIFLDILIVAYPMRLYHAIQPIWFGASYTIFSFVYYLCGGLNQRGQPFIYPVLNWMKPKKALTTTCVICILAVVIHTIFFFVYKLRVFTQRRLFIRREFDLPSTSKQTSLSC